MTKNSCNAAINSVLDLLFEFSQSSESHPSRVVTDGASYSSISASDLDCSFTAISGTADSHTAQQVGYVGAQRFVSLVMTANGATIGALSQADVIAGYPRNAPTFL